MPRSLNPQWHGSVACIWEPENLVHSEPRPRHRHGPVDLVGSGWSCPRLGLLDWLGGQPSGRARWLSSQSLTRAGLLLTLSTRSVLKKAACSGSSMTTGSGGRGRASNRACCHFCLLPCQPTTPAMPRHTEAKCENIDMFLKRGETAASSLLTGRNARSRRLRGFFMCCGLSGSPAIDSVSIRVKFNVTPRSASLG